MKCGLLGKELCHSYSPQIHSFFGDYPYTLFEKNPDEVADFLRTGNFTGINVTIPYKKTVLPYCTELTATAQKMGAVNTILRKDDGSLIGHNTDYFGFLSMLQKVGIPIAHKKALVLGSGGASATAQQVLLELNAKVVVISRSGENNYHNLHLHTDAALIVNCTPVGMYPDCGVTPIDLSLFPRLEAVLDMIYNPARTKLLLDAEKRNIPYENGLWMLVAQAKESAEWFLGKKLPDTIIASVYSAMNKMMQNIVLIGMPGCGKSTIGKLLSTKLGRTFVDADEALVNFAGRTIPEIFETSGENEFRQLETQVLRQLCKQSGSIIATGGGCVTRKENYDLLHQNSMIIWIQRDLDLLPTAGRPISQKTSAEALFRERKPLYDSFSDYTVINQKDPEHTVHAILELLK